MKLATRERKREAGFALLLVMVCIMALTLIVAGLWESSQSGWEENSMERAQYQAGLLAESGISLALHPDIEPGDQALRHEMAPGLSFEVLITSEESKIPVNSLTEEAWRNATVELFVSWGLDAATASVAADSLADWIDEDSDALPNGAENSYYSGFDFPEYPGNGPFTNIEQMLFVAGMDQVARFQPMWRDYFTIFSDGLVDLNAAPWEIIVALTGTTQDSAMNFVAVRNGDDGIEGTIDDYVFEDVGEVQSLLGISDSEWTEISSLVSLFGGVTRIESTGRVGEFEETRIVLAREAEGNSEVSFIVLARFRE
ncbi:MAG: type II secretion system protein GspK [Verrucomicrobiales bacterium]|nr:type II secretion system protein GspK [Verrucomicrobiales bacterium]